MDISKINFYELCLTESEEYYKHIYRFEEESFNKYIRENLKELINIDSFKEVIPSNEIKRKLESEGYEHVFYCCHYSAKAITILDAGFKYYTGFVELGMGYIITHSFNFLEEKLLDFARIEDSNDLIKDSCLPHKYYGINIPRDFVLKYKEETLEDKSMKPLLFEWIESNNFVKSKD